MVKHEWEYNGKTYKMYAWNKDCCVYNLWLKHGTFQELVGLEKIRDLGLKGVCIDVGANVGNHAVYFVRECKFRAVFAYEPVPQHFFCLSVNADKSFGRLITEPYAVMDKPGMVKLNYGKQAPENVWTTHDDEGDVLAVVIDDVYNETADIDLIKIDTEGTEITVLLGAEETIKRCKPYLYIEATQQHNKDNIESVISEYGYKDMFGNINPNGAASYIWGAR